MNRDSVSNASTEIPFAEALRYWFKLGFISFGGPAGQIALMHAELVEKRRWISEQRFLHALNYCMLLPGPEATQLAIYIGWLMHRTLGGIFAGLLFVMPSFLMLCGLAWVYLVFGKMVAISGVLYGIKPAVVALVLAAAWKIGLRTLKNRFLLSIAIAAFLLISVLHWPFPLIVIAALLTGIIGGRFTPKQFHAASSHQSSAVSTGPALIDDATPTPEHAIYSRSHLIAIGIAGIGIGIAVWMLIAWSTGSAGPLAAMGWFFTKAALMTFGGAYAVLPYVFDGAVVTHQWTTAAQMMDGLALGETTPGPLIMIVAFIGFVGGWSHVAIQGQPWLAGLIGGFVATFFTFLPSFIFILAGGPMVESTRGDLRFTAPLTAISAAVVGVIFSLALFFGWHVFHLGQPIPLWDWTAIVIAAGAAIALIRYRVGAVPLILICALIGLMLSWLD